MFSPEDVTHYTSCSQLILKGSQKTEVPLDEIIRLCVDTKAKRLTFVFDSLL